MSLKIRHESKLWTDKKLADHYKQPPALRMGIHPGWTIMMDDLSVGDLVSTYEGKIGLVSEILDETELEVRRIKVIIDGKAEVFFSFNLKKIEEKK